MLAVLIFISCSFSVFAAKYGDKNELDVLRSRFSDGKGPEINGYSIDYCVFSPVADENDGTKYPLVVWLHGLNEGQKPRSQLRKNNFVYWAREDFQLRFPEGGAFLLAARSPEEKTTCWSNELIEPLMAVITDFISTHKNVDASRIYLGGFSMGGKMTLRMAITYPDVFAAIFPICPAYAFTEEQLSYIKNIPMWLTASSRDVIAGWYTYSRDIWNSFCGQTTRKEDSRLSVLGNVYFPNGKKTTSNHHAWFAVTYDMFTEDGGDYYHMRTENAAGESVSLTYPNGMISWLSSFESGYDGSAPTVSGGNPLEEKRNEWILKSVAPILRALVCVIGEMIFGSSAC